MYLSLSMRMRSILKDSIDRNHAAKDRPNACAKYWCRMTLRACGVSQIIRAWKRGAGGQKPASASFR